MRAKLAAYTEFTPFVATFERFNHRDMPYPSLLLRDVTTAAGEPVADHVWVRSTLSLASAPLKSGCRITFEARAVPYQRANGTQDYQLGFVRNVKVMTPTEWADHTRAAANDQLAQRFKRMK